MAEGARRLLAPDEPAPVRLLRSDGRADFVLTADHAGRAIPRALSDLGLPELERLRHIAWDIGIAAVTERLAAALDAVAVMQRYSRLVIDCNRELSVEASIPPLSEATTIPGNIGLAAEQREARRREILAPYHAAIARLRDARRAAGRRTVLVAMHSFTPIFKGVPRRVEVGDARDIRMQQILLELLRAEGDLAAGDNAPYAITGTSDYTVPAHAQRRELPRVEIGIRQDLIADPAGQSASGGAPRPAPSPRRPPLAGEAVTEGLSRRGRDRPAPRGAAADRRAELHGQPRRRRLSGPRAA